VCFEHGAAMGSGGADGGVEGGVCQPRTCVDLNYHCGTGYDGCAGTLDCGPCPSPLQSCLANACVGCVPKNCMQLAANCGAAPDGCGGILDCGSCPQGKACTTGNLCASPGDIVEGGAGGG
jgi:hypothetical protein